MGVNIFLLRPDGSGHPDWDFLRLPGDGDLARQMVSLPHVAFEGGHRFAVEGECEGVIDDEPIFRPEAVSVWRAASIDPSKRARWDQLLDIIEAEPDVWIYPAW